MNMRPYTYDRDYNNNKNSSNMIKDLVEIVYLGQEHVKNSETVE